jgi:hypothetical protein
MAERHLYQLDKGVGNRRDEQPTNSVGDHEEALTLSGADHPGVGETHKPADSGSSENSLTNIGGGEGLTGMMKSGGRAR